MVRIISYKTRQREERATFCSQVLNIRNITKQTYLKIFPAINVHFCNFEENNSYEKFYYLLFLILFVNKL